MHLLGIFLKKRCHLFIFITFFRTKPFASFRVLMIRPYDAYVEWNITQGKDILLRFLDDLWSHHFIRIDSLAVI